MKMVHSLAVMISLEEYHAKTIHVTLQIKQNQA